MPARLCFVEGLPGSGKSTFAYSLQKQLLEANDDVVYYKEETSQPVDLFRQAIIPQRVFEELLMKVSIKTAQSMKANSYLLYENVIVAYTKVMYKTLELQTVLPQLCKYDIGDGRVSFDIYKEHHFLLWESFVQTYGLTHRVYIAEGAILHNQLLDILGFYDISVEEILTYFNTLASIIRPLSCRTYLLLPDDIEKLITITIQERGMEPNSWGAGFTKWMSLSPYCKKNNLSGVNGMVKIYKQMEVLSKQILDYIGCDYEVVIRSI
ncbi:hypothetical protein [Flavonifractor sp. An10]|uniref:hypothetical protein n=1 Tax=Flavonifractor sp. An10 TaxID=1965537 RepID=UPI000B3867E9|nr:hypothetical protein [Flavonifractor sp. An10]OUQ83821.1 hypothetical protein B5E42_03930 [Flavonifractor sp. An10]